MTSSGSTAEARPFHETDIRSPLPTRPLSPHSNTSVSPGLSSTVSSSRRPMRIFGPGRSWRIATWRPAAELGVLGVHLAVAVGEVQPRDVQARRDHAGQRVDVLAGRANRGDNLGSAHVNTGSY